MEKLNFEKMKNAVELDSLVAKPKELELVELPPNLVAIWRNEKIIDSTPSTVIFETFKIDMYIDKSYNYYYKKIDKLPNDNIKQALINIKAFTNWNNDKYYLSTTKLKKGINFYELLKRQKGTTAKKNIILTEEEKAKIETIDTKIQELQQQIKDLQVEKQDIYKNAQTGQLLNIKIDPAKCTAEDREKLQQQLATLQALLNGGTN